MVLSGKIIIGRKRDSQELLLREANFLIKIMKYLIFPLWFFISCNKTLPQNTLIIPDFSHEKELKSYAHSLSKTNPRHAALVLCHYSNILENSTSLQFDLVLYLRESGCFKKAIEIGTNIIHKKSSTKRKARLNFNIAESFAGLDDYNSAKHFFEKSIKSKNYYYYYRYAQTARYAEDFRTAHEMYSNAFHLTKGKKYFINHSFAYFLLEEAVRTYKKDPQKAKQNLEAVLNTPGLSVNPVKIRAEILYKQWRFN